MENQNQSNNESTKKRNLPPPKKSKHAKYFKGSTKCNKCKKTFTSKEAMEKHQQNNFLCRIETWKVLKCNICSKRIWDKKGKWYAHHYKHMKKWSECDPEEFHMKFFKKYENGINCPHCLENRLFKDDRSLRTHMYKFHRQMMYSKDDKMHDIMKMIEENKLKTSKSLIGYDEIRANIIITNKKIMNLTKIRLRRNKRNRNKKETKENEEDMKLKYDEIEKKAEEHIDLMMKANRSGLDGNNLDIKKINENVIDKGLKFKEDSTSIDQSEELQIKNHHDQKIMTHFEFYGKKLSDLNGNIINSRCTNNYMGKPKFPITNYRRNINRWKGYIRYDHAPPPKMTIDESTIKKIKKKPILANKKLRSFDELHKFISLEKDPKLRFKARIKLIKLSRKFNQKAKEGLEKINEGKHTTREYIERTFPTVWAYNNHLEEEMYEGAKQRYEERKNKLIIETVNEIEPVYNNDIIIDKKSDFAKLAFTYSTTKKEAEPALKRKEEPKKLSFREHLLDLDEEPFQECEYSIPEFTSTLKKRKKYDEMEYDEIVDQNKNEWDDHKPRSYDQIKKDVLDYIRTIRWINDY
jgi:hypothetical protein